MNILANITQHDLIWILLIFAVIAVILYVLGLRRP